MYSNKTSFVYGFHGIDKDVAFEILNQSTEFKLSNNDYDWLAVCRTFFQKVTT